jgi:hypothetical protein
LKVISKKKKIRLIVNGDWLIVSAGCFIQYLFSLHCQISQSSDYLINQGLSAVVLVSAVVPRPAAIFASPAHRYTPAKDLRLSGAAFQLL